MAKTLAIVFGIVFVLVGILGFATDMPLLGMFLTDGVHDAIHLVIGLVLLAMAGKNPVGAMKFFGFLYLLLAVIGFIQIGFGTAGAAKLLGIATFNGADNYLHLVLAVVLLVAAKASRNTVSVQM